MPYPTIPQSESLRIYHDITDEDIKLTAEVVDLDESQVIDVYLTLMEIRERRINSELILKQQELLIKGDEMSP